MESSTVTRSTRSRANSALSENSSSPTTWRKGRITRGKSQDIEKHVSTPMPSKTTRSQSSKHLTVSLTKLKSKLNSVEASAEENVVHEEEEIFDDKVDSTEVVQNESKENKSSSNVPDHVDDEQIKVVPSISKADESNGVLNSKNMDTQQSIANSNLPDAVDSLKSKPVELIESISVQDDPAAVAISITQATKWRQTLGGTIDLSTENESDEADESEVTSTDKEAPQMILGKLPSTMANNDVNELPTVNPSESSAAQLNNQFDLFSSNQNDIPIQAGTKDPIIDAIEKSNGTNTISTDIEFPKDSGSTIHQKSDGKHIYDNLEISALVTKVATSPQSTKPSIGQNDEVEQSVEVDEGDRSLFSDDEAETAIQKDSTDVTAIEENQISAAGLSLGLDMVEVKDSEISFAVSESSTDFLDTNDSDVNQKTEHRRRLKLPSTSEEDVSNELKNLETKPKKILKSKSLSDEMAVSKEVKKRMSLHPNMKLTSEKLKSSDVSLNEVGINVMSSKESFDSIQHGSKTDEEFRGRNRSHGNIIYDTSDEDVFKDMEKISNTKSSKRRSLEMPVSKEVKKRMSLHPNVKLSSGQLKKHDVSDDAQISKVGGDSTERQSKQLSEIGNAHEDDASKELENISANPEKIKKVSKGLSDSETMLRHKPDFKQMNLHPSTLLKSTTASLANSSLAKCDPKESHHASKASSMNNSDSNDDPEAMEVDQFVDSSETSNKYTSSDSNNETSQLKRKKLRKLKTEKNDEHGKQTVLTATPLRRKKDKKSKETSEADTNAIEKALIHRNFLLSIHATKSKIIATKVSKRESKRKMDATCDEDNLSIIKPKMKKQKIVQTLESSTPKIKSKTMKRYPTQQFAAKLNLKKNLKVGAKKFLPKMKWTTAGPFTVTKILSNEDFDVLLSTSHFTITSLSGSNFSFSSFKDGSTIHTQSSVGKR